MSLTVPKTQAIADDVIAQLEVERGCRSEWSDKIDALTSRWLG